MRRARLPSLLASCILMIAVSSTAAQAKISPCDPTHVLHIWKSWLVFPTGMDDTANIQCAFDHAAREQGSTVQLLAATYHTGQVAVIGFVGTFRGAGMNRTIVETLNRTLNVAPLDFLKKLPTPENGSNPWPSIFAFVGGDILVSDLTLKFSPNTWTTGWTWTGLGVTVYELAHGFVIVGPVKSGRSYTEANAALYRVRVNGVANQGALLGYLPINAAYFEGFLGASYGETLPLKGKFEVHDSQFRNVGGGTNLYNLFGSRVSITRNTFTDSFEGMDIGGSIVNTVYEYCDNKVLNNSAWGLNAYGPFSSSILLIKGNTFTGLGDGLYFDDSVQFGADVKCSLLKNGVKYMSDVGVYLGPGTSGCLVACKNPGDTVSDMGTNNKLVGCQAVPANAVSNQDVRPLLLPRNRK
jgi:hypothetical protein